MKIFSYLFIFASLALAQKLDYGTQFRGVVDARNATTTRPVKVGNLASRPATCVAGEVYFATDAIVQRRLQICDATNTWSDLAYSSGTADPGTCTVGQIFVRTDIPALKVCTATNTWTAISGGGGGYVTIQDEGGALTQRTVINFLGAGVSCTDDAGNGRTNCTISSGGSSTATCGATNASGNLQIPSTCVVDLGTTPVAISGTGQVSALSGTGTLWFGLNHLNGAYTIWHNLTGATCNAALICVSGASGFPLGVLPLATGVVTAGTLGTITQLEQRARSYAPVPGTGITISWVNGYPEIIADANTVYAAGTLTSGLPVIGAAGKNVAVGTRSGNTTEYATVAGAKTANKQLIFDANGNVSASAFDAGAAGGGGTAYQGPYSFWTGSLHLETATGPDAAIGTAGEVVLWREVLPVSISASRLVFAVRTTCATCGLAIAVMSNDRASAICRFATAVGGSGGASDLSSTGFKYTTAASGTGFSGGACTIPAGPVWIALATDGSVGLRRAGNSIENGLQSIGQQLTASSVAQVFGTATTGSGATLAVGNVSGTSTSNWSWFTHSSSRPSLTLGN